MSTSKTTSKSTRKRPRTSRRRSASARRRPTASRRLGPWAVTAVAVLGVVGFLLLGGRSGGASPATGVAPAFTLPSTDGKQVSLADYRGRDVLLFFNEGVGCDACFYQMVDLQKNAALFENAGVSVVPIVANPADQVRQEMARFGISTPYLIDADTSVSQAYGMLGNGMHANLPGHGFMFVDGSGRIRWAKEFPSMYVASSDLLAQLKPYLH
jgi:peroxiredoxin